MGFPRLAWRAAIAALLFYALGGCAASESRPTVAFPAGGTLSVKYSDGALQLSFNAPLEARGTFGRLDNGTIEVARAGTWTGKQAVTNRGVFPLDPPPTIVTSPTPMPSWTAPADLPPGRYRVCWVFFFEPEEVVRKVPSETLCDEVVV
jgi:hypothetical protein